MRRSKLALGMASRPEVSHSQVTARVITWCSCHIRKRHGSSDRQYFFGSMRPPRSRKWLRHLMICSAALADNRRSQVSPRFWVAPTPLLETDWVALRPSLTRPYRAAHTEATDRREAI